MGIEQHSASLVGPLAWGELTPQGEMTRTIRFCLTERTVTYPLTVLTKWEHVVGPREILAISAGHDCIRIEGRNLTLLRVALDAARLIEVKPSYRQRTDALPAVDSVTIEPMES